MEPIVPVILCGGAGTRLWPLSREVAPKPFVPLVDGRSTFVMTLDRVSDHRVFARPLVVASSSQRFLVSEALCAAAIEADILLEPVPRNTAAAVAAAAMVAARRDPGAMLAVLAADHLIRDTAEFVAAIGIASKAAAADYIVTFGVAPDSSTTSYGYIARGATLPGLPGVAEVAAFKEKPDAAAAAEFVASGYLWNSGNFVLRAAVAIAETERHAPDIVTAVGQALDGAAVASGHATLLAEVPYRTAPAISFDKAVMERTDRAAVVEARFDWRDLGTWESLRQIARRDAAGNATVGDVVLRDSRGTYVHAGRGRVAVIGVDNLVVATGGDDVLVAAQGSVDRIREVVASFSDGAREDDEAPVYKVSPWGYFQVVDEGAGYKVKRIVVEPGARLSLQRHRHRAEHWVVVAGAAEVTVGDDIRRLEANQSAFVPLGAIHRLANPGDDMLTLIEVQLGDYLGEDDIERLADDYDRLAER